MEQIHDTILPNALSIGVDYDLFWVLNPKSLQPFVKAFSLKQQYDDAVAWNIGRYVQQAISSNFAKNFKYPNKPMLADAGETVEAPEKKEMAMNEIKRRVLAHVAMINANKKRKEK